MLQFKVPDMTCGHCEKTIRTALADLPGVGQVDVDLAGKIVRIDGAVDATAIRHAITEAGYTVE